MFFRLEDQKALEQKPKPHEFGDYNRVLKVPFSFELVQMYEQLSGLAAPQEPLLFLDKKCTSPHGVNDEIDVIVSYEEGLVHGVDGLGNGVIIFKVNENYTVKLYGSDEKPVALLRSLSAIADTLTKI